jgi:hypothetical protein
MPWVRQRGRTDKLVCDWAKFLPSTCVTLYIDTYSPTESLKRLVILDTVQNNMDVNFWQTTVNFELEPERKVCPLHLNAALERGQPSAWCSLRSSSSVKLLCPPILLTVGLKTDRCWGASETLVMAYNQSNWQVQISSIWLHLSLCSFSCLEFLSII